MNNLDKWQAILPKQTWSDLQTLLEKTNAIRQNTAVYPATKHVLRALELTNPYDINVIIVGQDPYHGPGQANGLAFAVNKGTTPPPSLRNIDAELFAEYGEHLHSTTLEGWASQGVLLLNTSLTVEAGKPASHSAIGWQNVTEMILEACVWANPNSVILAWGRHAQDIAEKAIKPRKIPPFVIKTTHPSPFSANRPAGNTPAFIGSRCFKKTNEVLRLKGKTPIDWFKKG